MYTEVLFYSLQLVIGNIICGSWDLPLCWQCNVTPNIPFQGSGLEKVLDRESKACPLSSGVSEPRTDRFQRCLVHPGMPGVLQFLKEEQSHLGSLLEVGSWSPRSHGGCSSKSPRASVSSDSLARQVGLRSNNE